MFLKSIKRKWQTLNEDNEIGSRGLLYFRQIKGYSYEQASGVLSIDFHDGSIREYRQVPDAVYQKLKLSADENKYFDKYIYGSFPINC